MKQFYHFYIALNNVENISYITDTKQIEKTDKTWGLILEKTRVKPPEKLLERIAKKIEEMN